MNWRSLSFAKYQQILFIVWPQKQISKFLYIEFVNRFRWLWNSLEHPWLRKTNIIQGQLSGGAQQKHRRILHFHPGICTRMILEMRMKETSTPLAAAMTFSKMKAVPLKRGWPWFTSAQLERTLWITIWKVRLDFLVCALIKGRLMFISKSFLIESHHTLVMHLCLLVRVCTVLPTGNQAALTKQRLVQNSKTAHTQ